jgi:hypothetical protein
VPGAGHVIGAPLLPLLLPPPLLLLLPPPELLELPPDEPVLEPPPLDPPLLAPAPLPLLLPLDPPEDPPESTVLVPPSSEGASQALVDALEQATRVVPEAKSATAPWRRVNRRLTMMGRLFAHSSRNGDPIDELIRVSNNRLEKHGTSRQITPPLTHMCELSADGLPQRRGY